MRSRLFSLAGSGATLLAVHTLLTPLPWPFWATYGALVIGNVVVWRMPDRSVA